MWCNATSPDSKMLPNVISTKKRLNLRERIKSWFLSADEVEIGLRDVRSFPRPLIEDIAAFSGSIWRCIDYFLSGHAHIQFKIRTLTMQAHSNILGIRVADLMQSQIITHIRNLILSKYRLLDDPRCRDVIPWEAEPRFLQTSLEGFHQTMSICVIMYRAALSWLPDKD